MSTDKTARDERIHFPPFRRSHSITDIAQLDETHLNDATFGSRILLTTLHAHNVTKSDLCLYVQDLINFILFAFLGDFLDYANHATASAYVVSCW